MTETTDDKLLQQFFSDNRKEIEDNGFSRRVMHHLPNRYYRISQLWSLFCFTLAVVLFFVLDGLQLVLGALRETFTSAIKLIYSCNKSVCPYNNLVSPCLHFAGQGLIFFN